MGTYPQFVTCSVSIFQESNCGLTNKHLQDDFRKLRDLSSNRRVLVLAVMTVRKGGFSSRLIGVYKENINMILTYELTHNCSPFKNIYSHSSAVNLHQIACVQIPTLKITRSVTFSKLLDFHPWLSSLICKVVGLLGELNQSIYVKTLD